MSTGPMKRDYIMLRPLATGVTGFARLETDKSGLVFQLTGKNLHPHAKGVRVFLYAGEGAVQELGRAKVNAQGQVTLLAEVAARQSGFLPTRLQAVLVVTDDVKPGPLFIGLCVPQSAGSLLDAKNALLALCAKLGESALEKAEWVQQEPPQGSKQPAQAKSAALESAPPAKDRQEGHDRGDQPPPRRSDKTGPSAGAATARFALRTSTAIPRDNPPKEVFLSAVDPSIYVEADVYASRPPKGRPGTAAKIGDRPGAEPPAVGTALQAEEESPESALTPKTPGAAPVDRLRPLRWPIRWQQLAHYFEQYPPFAPFDLPGWRFVRVPMARGGSFAVGRLCQEDRVQRVAYAVPGQRNQPPPKEFARYRWHPGRDGQGYWVLWQQVKAQ